MQFTCIMIFNPFDQKNTCVCLSDQFNDNAVQFSSSKCSFMCDEVTLLTAECGGDKAFNVFYTGLNNESLRWIQLESVHYSKSAMHRKEKKRNKTKNSSVRLIRTIRSHSNLIFLCFCFNSIVEMFFPMLL